MTKLSVRREQRNNTRAGVKIQGNGWCDGGLCYIPFCAFEQIASPWSKIALQDDLSSWGEIIDWGSLEITSSVLSHRQEISEDYSQRCVPSGHRNIQKCVINPHTHSTHMLSDLERYKLLSTLLDPLNRAEHNRILIKGAKIKNQWVHRQVQTSQVNWTDSKSPSSLTLLSHLINCALHTPMRARSASVNKPRRLLHQHGLQRVVQSQRRRETGRERGIRVCLSITQTSSLPICDLYWLIHETAPPHLSLWPQRVSQSWSQQRAH